MFGRKKGPEAPKASPKPTEEGNKPTLSDEKRAPREEKNKGRTPEAVAMAERKAKGRKAEEEPYFFVKRKAMSRGEVTKMLALSKSQKLKKDATPEERKALEEELRANQERVMAGLRQHRPLVVRQLRVLEQQLKGISEKDQTIRGKLAGEVLKGMGKLQLERLVNLDKADPALELPAYKFYIWANSNYLVPGDEKEAIVQQYLSRKKKPERLEADDKKRAAQFAEYDKAKMPEEVQLRCLDRIMDQLNGAARFIRASSHNIDLEQKRSPIAAKREAYKKAQPPPEPGKKSKPISYPKDLQYPKGLDAKPRSVKGLSIDPGLLGYFRGEFKLEELQPDKLAAKYGQGMNPPPLPGYVPSSGQEKARVARAQQKATEKDSLRQLLVKTKNEQRLEARRTHAIRMLETFVPKTAQLADRRKKLTEIRDAFIKEPPALPHTKKRADEIVRKMNSILTAINSYALRLQGFEGTEAHRKTIGPGVSPADKPKKAPGENKSKEKKKEGPQIMSQKAAKALDQTYYNINNLWYGLPHGLETTLQEMFMALPDDLRTQAKLNNIHLDSMNSKSLIAGLRAAMGYYGTKEAEQREREKPKKPIDPKQLEADYKYVMTIPSKLDAQWASLSDVDKKKLRDHQEHIRRVTSKPLASLEEHEKRFIINRAEKARKDPKLK